MKKNPLLILFLILSLKGMAQKNDAVEKKIETYLAKAIDKKGVKPITGVRSVKFKGDTLKIETIVFTLSYPSLNFQQLKDVSEQENFSPTGFTTLWLNFTDEQLRTTDDGSPEKIKRFSLYVKKADYAEVRRLFLSLKGE